MLLSRQHHPNLLRICHRPNINPSSLLPPQPFLPLGSHLTTLPPYPCPAVPPSPYLSPDQPPVSTSSPHHPRAPLSGRSPVALAGISRTLMMPIGSSCFASQLPHRSIRIAPALYHLCSLDRLPRSTYTSHLLFCAVVHWAQGIVLFFF